MGSEPPLVFLRDLADVEPPRDRYQHYDDEDIYRLVPRPQWTGLEDEIWTPRSQEHDPQLEKVKALMKRNAAGGNGETSPGGAMGALSATKFANKLARKKRKNPRVKVRMFLNHKITDGIINILILWALFTEDLRVLCMPKETDVPIWWIHVFVMVVFTLEIILRWYSQPRYFNSFYFYLDTLATLTIFIDFMPLLQTPKAEPVGADIGTSSSDEDDPEGGGGGGALEGGATDAFRAAKTARVGTRIARLVRVLRIIRVIKLFVSSLKKGSKKDEEEVDKDEGAPSELSKALQGTMARRTIIFVLMLLGMQVLIDFIPFAGVDQFYLADDRYRLGTALFWEGIKDSPTSDASTERFEAMRQQLAAVIQTPLDINGFAPSAVLVPLFRIAVREYGPQKANYTFYPVPKRYTTSTELPCGVGLTRGYSTGVVGATGIFGHEYKRSTCERVPSAEYVDAGTYFDYGPSADTGTFSSDLGAGMDTWVPAWPAPEPAWGNCRYDCLHPVGVVDGVPDCLNECPNAYGVRRPMRELRTYGPAEIMRYFHIDKNTSLPVVEIWYGVKMAEDVQCGMSIILIICIAILLAAMGYLLSKDVDNMVIQPIESMVDSVTKLAANPAHQLEKVERVRYETDALKLSLAKIATMLQVGFGEAGNNLVAENLKKGDTVDPMVPGRKLLGAYGFCIIDEYEEVLECLGEDILPFTNTAASIVHDAVTDNGGQPNRNLGEAFLCVWKPEIGGEDPQTMAPAQLFAAETKMCDGALTAFRRCVRGIAMSGPLQAYNQHEEIVKFFDGAYSTRIGYGLHYGWAIEGAVGTNIKIDCSYLSPNVNLAARLESATKMYGVNILMSESFHSKLSPAMQKGLRRVDVVCLKGSSIPMAIYTCDRSNALYVSRKAIDKFGEHDVVDEFQRTFEEGMDEFVSGNWGASKTLFEKALWICPRDKPSQRILWHMDTHDNHPDYGLATTPYVAPEGWPGYHILLSK